MLQDDFYCILHTQQYRDECAAINGGRGIHAYLLEGAAGMGKKSFAALLACAFLCAGEKKPCMACKSCERVLHGQHPDVHLISGEKAIKVEQIREMTASAAVTPYEGGKKIYIADGFHTATEQAQNALLKTLEEPPESVVFFLLAENLLQVLPTVRSRCRVLHLYGYPQGDILRQLRLRFPEGQNLEEAAEECGGNIGRALELLRSEEDRALQRKARQLVQELETEASVPRLVAALEEQKDGLPQLLELLEELAHRRVQACVNTQERTLWLGRLHGITQARIQRRHNVNTGLIIEELAYGLVKGGTKWQR